MVHRAFEVLGLDPTATHEEIRSAYLARLRVTKPDRDPSGFKELRAAYEVLLGQRTPPLRREEEEAPVGIDPSADFLLRLAAASEEPSLERVKVVEQELSVRPGDVDLLRLLFDELRSMGLDDVAGEVLDDIAAKDPGFAWKARLEFFPSTMLGTWLADPPPGVSIDQRIDALRLVVRNLRQHQRAIKALGTLIEELSVEDLRQQAIDIAELVLESAAVGFARQGQELIRNVEGKLASQGGLWAPRFEGLSEWAECGEQVPTLVVRTTAAVIRHADGDFFLDYLDESDSSGSELLALLEASLPIMAQRFSAVILTPDPPSARPRTTEPVGLTGWFRRLARRVRSGPKGVLP